MMHELDAADSIVDWATECPESIAVFERLGIDYGCAGKSLDYACRQCGVDPQFVVLEVRRASAATRVGASLWEIAKGAGETAQPVGPTWRRRSSPG